MYAEEHEMLGCDVRAGEALPSLPVAQLAAFNTRATLKYPSPASRSCQSSLRHDSRTISPIMTAPRRIASLNSPAVLLRRPQATSRSSLSPLLRLQPRRCASSKDGGSKSKGEEGESFHGQLLNSTSSRVQRERAEQSRFANMQSNRYEGDTGPANGVARSASLAWAIGECPDDS